MFPDQFMTIVHDHSPRHSLMASGKGRPTSRQESSEAQAMCNTKRVPQATNPEEGNEYWAGTDAIRHQVMLGRGLGSMVTRERTSLQTGRSGGR